MTTGQGFIGKNMFAYCGNNPVVRADYTGLSWIKSIIKKGIQKLVKPAKKALENTISKINKTFSMGISLGGNMATVVGSGQVGISVDTKGNIAVQKTNAAGGTASTGKAGGMVGIYSMRTNAPTVNHLNGFGGQVGGSVGMNVEGIPLAAAFDVNVIPDFTNNKTYFGTTFTRGIGTPGADFHAMFSSTTPVSNWQINLYDIGDEVLDLILEW